MENTDPTVIGFHNIEKYTPVHYMDDNIIYINDVHEISHLVRPMKMDMCCIGICTKGKIQVEINSKIFQSKMGSVIICRNNDLIGTCMFSPDFEGQIICLSQQIISESFSESDILDQIFQITLNPVIRIDQDCQKIFRLYYDLMLLKIRQTEFIKHRKEILKSIIRAMMYELMETMTESDELSSIKQKDIIFKKFMNLLVSQTVKPRYISWYSDQLNITPKYLSTICKNVSGKTAFELINQYITADIRHLLKDTNRSIKEITHMLDFPNISFFGKYVKAHTGYSPTTYRIVLRNAE